MFGFYFNSNVVRTSSLLAHDNLYMFDSVTFYNESLNTKSHGSKHKINNTNSRAFWHRNLGHISKIIVEWLMSDGILDSIDFKKFYVCVECVTDK